MLCIIHSILDFLVFLPLTTDTNSKFEFTSLRVALYDHVLQQKRPSENEVFFVTG
jgi:hypothetical protein